MSFLSNLVFGSYLMCNLLRQIRCLSIVLVCGCGLGQIALAIDLDITFDTGQTPTDFGFTTAGTKNPADTVANGVWEVDNVTGESATWNGHDLVAGATGPFVHGWSEIQVVDFADGTNDDKTAFAFGKHTETAGEGNEYAFLLYFGDGYFAAFGSGLGEGDLAEFSVENNDGEYHKYGWQIHEPTGELTFYFDDVVIGGGVLNNLNFAQQDIMYFGDGHGGGNHRENWTRVVVGEGRHPAGGPILEGDFNGDGQVNVADYTVWRDNLGAVDESSLGGNGDNQNGVDIGDYNLWKMHFGESSTPANLADSHVSVPEPTGIALALFGLILAPRVYAFHLRLLPIDSHWR